MHSAHSSQKNFFFRTFYEPFLRDWTAFSHLFKKKKKIEKKKKWEGPCRGGYPGRFFQRPVTGTRHSGCYVARCFFAICSFLTDPIFSVGHSVGVVARVYGRPLVFFQRPRSSSWWPLRPGSPWLPMYFRWYCTQRLPSVCKVTNETRHPSPFPSTSVTRQCIELFRHTISPCFGVSRIEFQFCYLWIRFVSQGVVCFHSVGFGGHTQDNQYAPCIFVDNPLKGSQVLARVHTKQVISHFSIVTRQCTGTLSPHHFASSCRFTDWVSVLLTTDSICFGFGGSWTVTMIFLNVSRCSTLFVSFCILFA
jgi:hypothetical protein